MRELGIGHRATLVQDVRDLASQPGKNPEPLADAVSVLDNAGFTVSTVSRTAATTLSSPAPEEEDARGGLQHRVNSGEGFGNLYASPEYRSSTLTLPDCPTAARVRPRRLDRRYLKPAKAAPATVLASNGGYDRPDRNASSQLSRRLTPVNLRIAGAAGQHAFGVSDPATLQNPQHRCTALLGDEDEQSVSVAAEEGPVDLQSSAAESYAAVQSTGPSRAGSSALGGLLCTPYPNQHQRPSSPTPSAPIAAHETPPKGPDVKAAIPRVLSTPDATSASQPSIDSPATIEPATTVPSVRTRRSVCRISMKLHSGHAELLQPSMLVPLARLLLPYNWALAGMAARPGCIELALDYIQLDDAADATTSQPPGGIPPPDSDPRVSLAAASAGSADAAALPHWQVSELLSHLQQQGLVDPSLEPSVGVQVDQRMHLVQWLSAEAEQQVPAQQVLMTAQVQRVQASHALQLVSVRSGQMGQQAQGLLMRDGQVAEREQQQQQQQDQEQQQEAESWSPEGASALVMPKLPAGSWVCREAQPGTGPESLALEQVVAVRVVPACQPVRQDVTATCSGGGAVEPSAMVLYVAASRCGLRGCTVRCPGCFLPTTELYRVASRDVNSLAGLPLEAPTLPAVPSAHAGGREDTAKTGAQADESSSLLPSSVERDPLVAAAAAAGPDGEVVVVRVTELPAWSGLLQVELRLPPADTCPSRASLAARGLEQEGIAEQEAQQARVISPTQPQPQPILPAIEPLTAAAPVLLLCVHGQAADGAAELASWDEDMAAGAAHELGQLCARLAEGRPADFDAGAAASEFLFDLGSLLDAAAACAGVAEAGIESDAGAIITLNADTAGKEDVATGTSHAAMGDGCPSYSDQLRSLLRAQLGLGSDAEAEAEVVGNGGSVIRGGADSGGSNHVGSLEGLAVAATMQRQLADTAVTLLAACGSLSMPCTAQMVMALATRRLGLGDYDVVLQAASDGDYELAAQLSELLTHAEPRSAVTVAADGALLSNCFLDLDSTPPLAGGVQECLATPHGEEGLVGTSSTPAAAAAAQPQLHADAEDGVAVATMWWREGATAVDVTSVNSPATDTAFNTIANSSGGSSGSGGCSARMSGGSTTREDLGTLRGDLCAAASRSDTGAAGTGLDSKQSGCREGGPQLQPETSADDQTTTAEGIGGDACSSFPCCTGRKPFAAEINERADKCATRLGASYRAQRLLGRWWLSSDVARQFWEQMVACFTGFKSPAVEQAFWLDTAARLQAIYLFYSLISIVFVSLSSLRAFLEDGLSAGLFMCLYQGGQAVLLAAFGLWGGGRPSRLLGAGMGSTALRCVCHALLSRGLAPLPSFVLPVCRAGGDLFNEACAKPMLEQLPMWLFLTGLICLELPTAYGLYVFLNGSSGNLLTGNVGLRLAGFAALKTAVAVGSQAVWRMNFQARTAAAASSKVD